MDSRKEVLPLRIVAARFISRDEQTGLAELDRITADVYALVQKKYLLLWTAFSATLFATAITLIPGIVYTLLGARGGDSVLIIGLVAFSLMMGVLAYWRVFQYGGMKASVPQKPVHADADDPAVLNLERLFAALQRESTPRAFYFMKNGVRREIDETYFYGSLRAAYVAKGSPIRDALLAPVGFWFTREIFMEVDVKALIEQAKAKPNRPGPKKSYDYTDAVMSLIEHPEIRAITEVRRKGNQTKIKRLLEAWFHSRRLDAPGDSQLTLYASSIQDVMEKNRAANTRR